MKLLLIEDNTAVQTTLQRSFERAGMQGVVCSDAARAFDRLARLRARRRAARPDPAAGDPT